MGADLDKLVLYSKNNSFKNDAVYRDNLVIPASVAANTIYTDSVTFAIPDGVDYCVAFAYFTNYSDRLFAGTPFTTYNNQWQRVNEAWGAFIISASAGILLAEIIQRVDGDNITVTLRISRQGTTATGAISGSGNMPVSMVAYSMAN